MDRLLRAFLLSIIIFISIVASYELDDQCSLEKRRIIDGAMKEARELIDNAVARYAEEWDKPPVRKFYKKIFGNNKRGRVTSALFRLRSETFVKGQAQDEAKNYDQLSSDETPSEDSTDSRAMSQDGDFSLIILCDENHLTLKPTEHEISLMPHPREVNYSWCPRDDAPCIPVPEDGFDYRARPQKPCRFGEGKRKGAYVYDAWDHSPDLETFLVVCDINFHEESLRGSLASARHVDMKNGGNNYEGWPLDEFRPLSSTLIHMISHAIPGIYTCEDIAVHDVGELDSTAAVFQIGEMANIDLSDEAVAAMPPIEGLYVLQRAQRSLRNAESYAKLLVGLYLEEYDWSTGTAQLPGSATFAASAAPKVAAALAPVPVPVPVPVAVENPVRPRKRRKKKQSTSSSIRHDTLSSLLLSEEKMPYRGW
ncbi:MAG: hypothetical protein M1825_005287 [Sarcosagium campestre]|nr:MAG: hypothetical protein M1825_005287 [Sarcosagium campestre]